MEPTITKDAGKTVNGRVMPHGHVQLPPTRFTKAMMALDGDIKEIAMAGGGKIKPFKRKVLPDDYQQSLVHDPARYAAGLTDYFTITLKGRGRGTPDFVKRMLINPDAVSVNYEVRDTESNSRGGYQVGVWGEMATVSISGWTAGRYFAGRLMDEGYAHYAASYRDLQELVAVYENNGNWYEGEDAAGDSRLVPLDASRRVIRCHGNVILRFGNFLWEGLFTQMQVTDDATKPWVSKYTLSFQVLRERYLNSSPWRNSIAPDVRYRGHAYELVSQYAADRLLPRNATPPPSVVTAKATSHAPAGDPSGRTLQEMFATGLTTSTPLLTDYTSLVWAKK